MREIIFRGKDKVNGNWIYGSLEIPLTSRKNSKHYILGYSYGQYQKHEVDPITVGQFVGLTDQNNKPIYEGDIIDSIWVVTYVDESDSANLGMDVGWYIQRDNFESWGLLQVGEKYEVIGNIHDNPELLGRY